MAESGPLHSSDVGMFEIEITFNNLTWKIRKTNEEITRFLNKLSPFHSKITSPFGILLIKNLEKFVIPEKHKNIESFVFPEEYTNQSIEVYQEKIFLMLELFQKKVKGKLPKCEITREGIVAECENLLKFLLHFEKCLPIIKIYLEGEKILPSAENTSNKRTSSLIGKSKDPFAASYKKFSIEYSKCLQAIHLFIEYSSHTSAVLGSKGKEGYIYKRTGGRHTLNQMFFYICKYFRRLQKRWLILTENGLIYLQNHKSETAQRVLGFKDRFNLISDDEETKYIDALIVRTTKENFLFHTGSKAKKEEWRDAIIAALNRFNETNPKKEVDEGMSFPVRPNNKAKWYVDGEGYFRDIHDALLEAKERVFITDWWLCSEMYLKRPASQYPNSKIFEVFIALVEKQPNIKIFIHMYREPEPALDLGSEHTERFLSQHPKLCNNIKIMRHPERGLSGLKLFYAHHEKICVIDDKIAFLGGIDLCYGRWDTHEHKLTDPNKDEQFFPGADYSNPRMKEVIDIRIPHDEQHSRDLPRMPWHDIGLSVEGTAARDASSHFMDLWNWASTDSANFKRKNKGVLSSSTVRAVRGSEIIQPLSAGMPFEIFKVLLKKRTVVESKIGVRSTSECQILRSVAGWSYGIPDPEHSIMDMYVKLIRESKKFIYIENQFFISSTAGGPVKNTIAQELVDRIMRAHIKNEKFRVVVCMPLLPAFEGEVREDTAAVLKIQLYWEYLTIFRSPTSIYKQLEDAGIRAKDYINFYGLRTHDFLNNKPVTEIVYIHSKCMIVDDDIAIIGSANINDRSMLGDHDSEIACCINDQHKIQSRMNRQPFEKGQFALTMRKRIFNEFIGNETRLHRGRDQIDLEDPLDPDFIQAFESTARGNTQLYNEIFECYPNDQFRNFEDLKKAAKNAEDISIQAYRKKLYEEKKNMITGFIVEFPRYFLEGVDLKPARSSKEGMAPSEVFI